MLFVQPKPFPDEVPPLHPFFEKIIDKKVDQVALNIFESIADFFSAPISMLLIINDSNIG